MHLFKKYLNFSNKINFYKLAIDHENEVNVSKHSQLFKDIAVLDWWESSQRFKRYINCSEIFTHLSPPVNLIMRSRSPKFNQLLRLS